MSDKNHVIELGDRVKDPISGCQGIVICLTTWLNGCRRVILQPEGLKDGSPIKDEAFDDTLLEIIEKQVFVPRTAYVVMENVPTVTPEAPRTPGGPPRESSFSRDDVSRSR